MTKNMTTYANIKLAEIFALYGNPFTRGSCKKNFRQKLRFNYYKRVNFIENVSQEKNFSSRKNFFNGTLFPLKMNFADNFSNHNYKNILSVKRVSNESLKRNSSNNPNYDNNSNLSNNMSNNISKEKSNNIISSVNFAKIEKERKKIKKIKSIENFNKSDKFKELVIERKEASMKIEKKLADSMTPTKEPFDSIGKINMNSTDFVDFMTMNNNKKEKN